jgi:protein gp37
MSEQTKIEWCDSTVNFWSGCTKVSPGCANCYAEARDKRHMIEPKDHWGKGADRLKHVGAVKQALAFNRKPWVCDECGEACVNTVDGDCKNGCYGALNKKHRRRIFSLSLGDWLDEEVKIEWLAEMLDTIRQCDQVEWILCTKRPENFTARLSAVNAWCDGVEDEALCEFTYKWGNGNAPQQITLLTSVENQEQADKRIPELLKIPAACRGLSLEPLLGPVNLRSGFDGPQMFPLGMGIKWLIIGGESGPGARTCNVEWIRSLVQQGKDAGVATFVKQLGANVVHEAVVKDANHDDAAIVTHPPPKLKHPKGGDITEWPEDLRVQEWPSREAAIADSK